jgi:hypothetical protein
MSKSITVTKSNGEKVTLTGAGKITFELSSLVRSFANDLYTEEKALTLIEELAVESEKHGYDRGYHTGFHEGCKYPGPPGNEGEDYDGGWCLR